MLQDLPCDPLDQALAINDRLVPPPSLWKGGDIQTPSFDKDGFSEYARIINSLLYVMMSDRGLARQNMWLLRHFVALQKFAQDVLNLPAGKSVVFGNACDLAELLAIISRVDTISAFLFTDVGDDVWHASIVQAISEKKSTPLGDAVGRFVQLVVEKAIKYDSYREARGVNFFLRHLLSGATMADADHWMTFARKVEKECEPYVEFSIIYSGLTGIGSPLYFVSDYTSN